VKQGSGLPEWMRRTCVACLLVLLSSFGWSQTSSSAASSSPSDSTAAVLRELQQQVNELRSAMAEMRSESEQYRAENAELRHELQAVHSPSASAAAPQVRDSYPSSPPPASADPDSGRPSPTPPKANPNASLEERVASLEESTQLVNSKVDDQYQTKVESASKYRVRLSGIVLLNLFNSHGDTDNLDFPSFVKGPSTGTGSFGATMRQSEIGLEVFGPTLAGAKTSATLQADFAGGLPSTWNGVDFGVFRLRTASMRMDWKDTSIVAGQDSAFFSPLSPTSFASLAVPALNYAGNLWAWTPQVRVEHRFELSGDQNILLQGGILDNLTGEFPPDSYFRAPGPGELTRQPAYAIRTAWARKVFGQPLTLGLAGYYSRQEWDYDHYVDGWSGMADWEIPLAPRVLFTGEFYRGKAMGGIGGGIGQSVVYEGNPGNPSTPVRGLDAIGGWSQLKFKATSTLEFNVAFGLDNPTTAEVRAAAASQSYLFGPLMVQNRGSLVNFVFRPRSNLLFSGEYGHLRTAQLNDVSYNADQFNLIMGILF
jgi:hypothetical protein